MDRLLKITYLVFTLLVGAYIVSTFFGVRLLGNIILIAAMGFLAVNSIVLFKVTKNKLIFVFESLAIICIAIVEIIDMLDVTTNKFSFVTYICTGVIAYTRFAIRHGKKGNIKEQ